MSGRLLAALLCADAGFVVRVFVQGQTGFVVDIPVDLATLMSVPQSSTPRPDSEGAQPTGSSVALRFPPNSLLIECVDGSCASPGPPIARPGWSLMYCCARCADATNMTVDPKGPLEAPPAHPESDPNRPGVLEVLRGVDYERSLRKSIEVGKKKRTAERTVAEASAAIQRALNAQKASTFRVSRSARQVPAPQGSSLTWAVAQMLKLEAKRAAVRQLRSLVEGVRKDIVACMHILIGRPFGGDGPRRLQQ